MFSKLSRTLFSGMFRCGISITTREWRDASTIFAVKVFWVVWCVLCVLNKWRALSGGRAVLFARTLEKYWLGYATGAREIFHLGGAIILLLCYFV